MAHPPVPPIERLGVDSVELLHPPREVCPRRFHQQMVVIGQQAISMTDPAEVLDQGREGI